MISAVAVTQSSFLGLVSETPLVHARILAHKEVRAGILRVASRVPWQRLKRLGYQAIVSKLQVAFMLTYLGLKFSGGKVSVKDKMGCLGSKEGADSKEEETKEKPTFSW